VETRTVIILFAKIIYVFVTFPHSALFGLPQAQAVSMDAVLARTYALESVRWRDFFLSEIALEYANDADFVGAKQCLIKISDIVLQEYTSLRIAKCQVSVGQADNAVNTLELGLKKKYSNPEIRANCLAEIGLHENAERVYLTHDLRFSPVCLARLGNTSDAFDALLVAEGNISETNDELVKLGFVCLELEQFDAINEGYKLLLGDRAEFGLAWLVLSHCNELGQDRYAAAVRRLKLDKRFPILLKNSLVSNSRIASHFDERVEMTLCGANEICRLRVLIQHASIAALNNDTQHAKELIENANIQLPKEVSLYIPSSFSHNAELSFLKANVMSVQAMIGDVHVVHLLLPSLDKIGLTVGHIELARSIGSFITVSNLKAFQDECDLIGLPKEVSIALAIGAKQKHMFRKYEGMRIWTRILAGKNFANQIAVLGTHSITSNMIPLFADSTPISLQERFFRVCDKSPKYDTRTQLILRCAPPHSLNAEVLITCLDSQDPIIKLNALRRIVNDEVPCDMEDVHSKVGSLLTHDDPNVVYSCKKILEFVQEMTGNSENPR
jgi:hypothetical protein